MHKSKIEFIIQVHIELAWLFIQRQNRTEKLWQTFLLKCVLKGCLCASILIVYVYKVLMLLRIMIPFLTVSEEELSLLKNFFPTSLLNTNKKTFFHACNINLHLKGYIQRNICSHIYKYFCASRKYLIMSFQSDYFKESSIHLLELRLLSRNYLMSVTRVLDLSDIVF